MTPPTIQRSHPLCHAVTLLQLPGDYPQVKTRAFRRRFLSPRSTQRRAFSVLSALFPQSRSPGATAPGSGAGLHSPVGPDCTGHWASSAVRFDQRHNGRNVPEIAVDGSSSVLEFPLSQGYRVHATVHRRQDISSEIIIDYQKCPYDISIHVQGDQERVGIGDA